MDELSGSIVGNKTLIAFEPGALRETQESLKDWLKEKHTAAVGEQTDLETAADTAKKNKWNWKPIGAAARNAAKRAEYYDKAFRAVDAGYLLIPPFPLKVFAVRVDNDEPRNKSLVSYQGGVSDAQSTASPAGEGEYVGDVPLVSIKHSTDDKGNDKKLYWASGYSDVAFPLEAVKPELMERASKAMALKIFDEIGLVGQARADPIMVGTVLLKRGWLPKRMNFFLAWWIDKSAL